MADNLVPFSYRKRGYFYFNRRIPADLRHHYSSDKVVYSLKTKSVRVATNYALTAAAQLDAYWFKLRIQNEDVPRQHFAVSDRPSVAPTVSSVDLGPKMSDAVQLYIRLKGNNRPKTFAASAERAGRYLIKARGNKRLLDYTKSDATAFRDTLIDRGMNGNSVTRVFGTIKSIVTFAANESGLTMINPFMGVYFDNKHGVTVRQPIPIANIRVVQKTCNEKDDDIRWLVAMVADTGMRLAEAAGLHLSDIHLDDGDVPFVRIQPHPWRRLKTKGSERDVPLVGSSYWAARRIVQNTDEGDIAFPRYNRTATTNAGSASATINKWLKQYVPEGCTMHGFRHSMRDRLRDVECPTEIADQIGGWSSSASVGQTYGTGYSLIILHRWIKDAVD